MALGPLASLPPGSRRAGAGQRPRAYPAPSCSVRPTRRRARCPPAPCRARAGPRGRGAVHAGRMTARRAASRAPVPTASRRLYKDAAVAHELGLRRKLARHRGAVFMGPAALPRWPLALASRWSRAWGSPRFAPDNAAYAKLRLSSARLALHALPCACGRASRTHPMSRKARAGRSFKHCRH